MLIGALHREDIKALLRKRYGTLGRFADQHGLKAQAVADYLRGRPVRHVHDAITAELVAANHTFERSESIKLDHNEETSDAHRQNSEAE